MVTRTDIPFRIDVYAGKLVVAEVPFVLVAPALGSCVALALWDAKDRRGGLAHVMLPESANASRSGDMGRFADHAVELLLEKMDLAGSPHRRLVAKLAGGSAMFKGESALASIGERNAIEVRRQLAKLGIPNAGEDTGGSHARTVELHTETGVVVVRSYAFGMREL